MSTLSASDLFCGLGGFSAGLLDACRELNRTPELLAINHWDKAIETHRLNHPSVSHLCENLDNVDPRKVVTSGKLDVLLASPECTHFSNARGGKPMSDQSRSSAWHILRWCEALRIENVVVENVKEFQTWGPLDRNGRPVASKKGELFRKFCECLDVMGYKVDFRVLNSAHYGAATARHRLFIQAVRRRRPRWPEQTHSATPDLFAQKPFRAAREIIDWDLEGQSIFGRKRPLSPNTLRRIEAGLRKFGGVDFVLGQQSCSAPRNLDGPIPTIATAGAISLIEPFLVRFNGDHANRDNSERLAQSIPEPMSTLDTSNRFGLCEPFVVNMKGQSTACDVNKPAPTITAHAPHLYLAEPFMVQYYGSSGAAPCSSPLPTVTTKDRFGLCEPEPVSVFERDSVQYALMDIRFRMLQPHELAAAMGLEDYKLTGTKRDKTKMIGNAVERNTSRALCRAVLQ